MCIGSAPAVGDLPSGYSPILRSLLSPLGTLLLGDLFWSDRQASSDPPFDAICKELGIPDVCIRKPLSASLLCSDPREA